jgi:hypothetical protein
MYPDFRLSKLDHARLRRELGGTRKTAHREGQQLMSKSWKVVNDLLVGALILFVLWAILR